MTYSSSPYGTQPYASTSAATVDKTDSAIRSEILATLLQADSATQLVETGELIVVQADSETADETAITAGGASLSIGQVDSDATVDAASATISAGIRADVVAQAIGVNNAESIATNLDIPLESTAVASTTRTAGTAIVVEDAVYVLSGTALLTATDDTQSSDNVLSTTGTSGPRQSAQTTASIDEGTRTSNGTNTSAGLSASLTQTTASISTPRSAVRPSSSQAITTAGATESTAISADQSAVDATGTTIDNALFTVTAPISTTSESASTTEAAGRTTIASSDVQSSVTASTVTAGSISSAFSTARNNIGEAIATSATTQTGSTASVRNDTLSSSQASIQGENIDGQSDFQFTDEITVARDTATKVSVDSTELGGLTATQSTTVGEEQTGSASVTKSTRDSTQTIEEPLLTTTAGTVDDGISASTATSVEDKQVSTVSKQFRTDETTFVDGKGNLSVSEAQTELLSSTSIVTESISLVTQNAVPSTTVKQSNETASTVEEPIASTFAESVLPGVSSALAVTDGTRSLFTRRVANGVPSQGIGTDTSIPTPTASTDLTTDEFTFREESPEYVSASGIDAVPTTTTLAIALEDEDIKPSLVTTESEEFTTAEGLQAIVSRYNGDPVTRDSISTSIATDVDVVEQALSASLSTDEQTSAFDPATSESVTTTSRNSTIQLREDVLRTRNETTVPTPVTSTLAIDAGDRSSAQSLTASTTDSLAISPLKTTGDSTGFGADIALLISAQRVNEQAPPQFAQISILESASVTTFDRAVRNLTTDTARALDISSRTLSTPFSEESITISTAVPKTVVVVGEGGVTALDTDTLTYVTSSTVVGKETTISIQDQYTDIDMFDHDTDVVQQNETETTVSMNDSETTVRIVTDDI